MSISPGDFALVRELSERHAGIVLDPGKEYLVEARLTPLARTLGFPDMSDLLAKARTPGQSALVARVVEAMTTNETSFFRDVLPFDVLRTTIIPALIEARRSQKRLNIWYCASSTGQEPYSVSMLLREHFPELQGWQLTQLATDISPQVLARARDGRYNSLEVNRGLPVNLLLKYFTKVDNDWQLNDEIRRMVRFEELNLVNVLPPMGPFDIVFLRNVMIYFDVPVKKQILSGVRRMLRPDGYLFLGAAETTLRLDDAFAREVNDRAGCYRLRRTAVAV